ncbi:MAG: T9SS type A sorting domain-containing protein [Psychroserpens sp.]|nr:T9SS type A sorting domain-containing protein [Psychroserpens sp.]
MKKLPFIFLIFTNCVIAQLVNGGFEDTIIDFNIFEGIMDEHPVGWTFYGAIGTEITSDAYEGNKAVKIWSWYFGQANTQLIYGENYPSFGDTISSIITKLKGFYKFTDVVIINEIVDSAYLEFAITKFNLDTNARDTLAFVTKNLPPTDNYIEFEIPVTYENLMISDSLFLKFRSSYLQSTGSSVEENNFLYLDNIELETSNLSLVDYNFGDVKVYPNPVEGFLYVGPKRDSYEFEFYSIEGKSIKKGINIGINKIDISRLSKGIYFLKVIMGNRSKVFKIIKN